MAKYSIILEDKPDGSVGFKIDENIAPQEDTHSEAATLANMVWLSINKMLEE